MSALAKRLDLLEQKTGHYLVCLSLLPDEDFWTASQRVIDKGIEMENIDLGAIIKEIHSNVGGWKYQGNVDTDIRFALVELQAGEFFADAIQRLKSVGTSPEIFG